ncbi:hypothetical protein D4764_11G0003370 [Takifugu flavidus]|uniref:Reverse transcriptase zinc-binding domain-containing protein n=1 Tax=Takifugu flavidus TaxID=433684 RepID=A0A5C6PH18_9TELE|nr:hypothetical protein D4764_11G0003370 [Takifugu flavidus]
MVLNQRNLAGRVDTKWRTQLALTETQRPEWRSLYKPQLTWRGGDQQWRILHGAIAVNGFLSYINPNISAECPFCNHRETVFHCFSECDHLSVLFLLLNQMFSLLGEAFSQTIFILGFRYHRRGKAKCQLLNLFIGQAKLAIYKSRRNKIGGSLDYDLQTIFARMVNARIKTDFNFYRATNNIEEFKSTWCLNDELCLVEEEELVFGGLLNSVLFSFFLLFGSCFCFL